MIRVVLAILLSSAVASAKPSPAVTTAKAHVASARAELKSAREQDKARRIQAISTKKVARARIKAEIATLRESRTTGNVE